MERLSHSLRRGEQGMNDMPSLIFKSCWACGSAALALHSEAHIEPRCRGMSSRCNPSALLWRLLIEAVLTVKARDGAQTWSLQFRSRQGRSSTGSSQRASYVPRIFWGTQAGKPDHRTWPGAFEPGRWAKSANTAHGAQCPLHWASEIDSVSRHGITVSYSS